MIYLMQILKMMDKLQRRDFLLIFTDLEIEAEWQDCCKYTLAHSFFFDQWGLDLTDDKQLKCLVDSIVKNNERLVSIVDMVDNMAA